MDSKQDFSIQWNPFLIQKIALVQNEFCNSKKIEGQRLTFTYDPNWTFNQKLDFRSQMDFRSKLNFLSKMDF